MIGLEQRSPDRPRDRHGLRGLPGNLDDLVMALELSPPLWREVLVRPRGVDVDEDDVAPVGVGIGKAPRDVRVAAGHDGWNARQRHAEVKSPGN